MERAGVGCAVSEIGDSHAIAPLEPQSERRAWQAGVLTRVLPRIRDVRRGGSAAIDLSSVASGQVDAFFEAGLAEWDMAAGIAIVRAAGGSVEVLERPSPPSPLIVAGGPRLVGALVACLRDAGALDAMSPDPHDAR